MTDELSELARSQQHSYAEPAFEIVYEFDSKGASRAYKKFLWRRARRMVFLLSAIAVGCVVAILFWEMNLFLVLGAAYPAAYIVMWYVQVAQIEEGYEALHGRKFRLLFDGGGMSSYSGNTFKRVQWPGVTRMVLIGGYYFVYCERDPMPSGGFSKSIVGEDVMRFVREHTRVVE